MNRQVHDIFYLFFSSKALRKGAGAARAQAFQKCHFIISRLQRSPFSCGIALVIAAIMFFFTNDIKEIGQNKLNITQKFCLIVAFLSLVGLVTLFQTSISPN